MKKVADIKFEEICNGSFHKPVFKIKENNMKHLAVMTGVTRTNGKFVAELHEQLFPGTATIKDLAEWRKSVFPNDPEEHKVELFNVK